MTSAPEESRLCYCFGACGLSQKQSNKFWVIKGDHLSGKPGNVREFETCQGNVRDVVKSQGIAREMSGKNIVMEKCPKTVHY